MGESVATYSRMRRIKQAAEAIILVIVAGNAQNIFGGQGKFIGT